MRVREYWTHGLSTIVDFARKPVSSDAVQAIREALEFAGIEFIDENGGRPRRATPQAPAA
jgi:hypothetical protein